MTPLILMVPLALPGAAHALGLGEIHVDSALNQPLAAEIDIVGATPENLTGITASVANPETFRRFGADRPAFLSSIAFKITRDSKGRPVLAIRSTDTFTEPLVNLLIDLRWRGGELIRQYALLLDPVTLPSTSRVAEAEPIAGAPAIYAAEPAALPTSAEQVLETSKPAAQLTPSSERTSRAVAEAVVARKTVKIGARATLRGVAWRVGSRADADLKRMMIAIFRANPSAFEGNINRLRRGAVLTIPSVSEVSAISTAEANREIHAQMESWHAATKLGVPVKLGARAVAAQVSAPLEAVIPTEPAALSQESSSKAPDGVTGARGNTAGISEEAEVTLSRRVQTLEKELNELQGLLDREHDRSIALQASVALAEKVPAVPVVPPRVKSGRAVGLFIAATLALATGTFGLLHAWRRRRTLKPQISPPNSQAQDTDAVQIDAEAASAVRSEAGPGTPVPDELHRDGQFEAKPQRAKDEELPSVAAGSSLKRTILGAHAPDGIDARSLEASYLLDGSGGGLEDTVNLADSDETANLPSPTMKIFVDDANAETMPVETARMMGMFETSNSQDTAQHRRMRAGPANADTTKLDYNLVDLDASVHHVQLPSMLYESVGFKERRTSLVDVLKIAVEREPNRRDLRMKLLETHYAAAAANRQGFLEVVERLAHERENMTDDEWDKIAWMGRQIAPDNNLFASSTAQTDDEDLADCA